jgi:glycosyltransferase involved in cell wall biosynthesis
LTSRPDVLQVFQPPRGGAPEHVTRLSIALQAAGWDVEVAGPADSHFLGILGDAGIATHTIPFGRKPELRDVHAARALRELVRRRRPALVHAHSSKAGALVRLAVGPEVPVIYTPHCFAFAAGFGAGQRAAYRVVEQLLVRRATAVVAVSAWEHAQAVSALRGLSRRIVLIRHGVPPADPAEPPAWVPGWARGRPVLGFLGRVEEEKGPVRFVQAFARACEDPAFTACGLVVGDGTAEAAVHAEIAATGLGERLRHEPFGGRMGPWLAALDLLVLPSRWESLPLAILEAMQAGVPVLSTDVGGVGEAITDGVTGCLVPPGDEAALARAMAQLAADPVRRAALAAAARERVQRDFATQRMVDQTATLYRTILQRRPAAVLPVAVPA